MHAVPCGYFCKNDREPLRREAIDGVIEAALFNAGVSPADLSAVAVTVGPGLSMCLRVGVVAAQNLCALHSKPIIPIHHMAGTGAGGGGRSRGGESGR